jgi:hypothetical protein
MALIKAVQDRCESCTQGLALCLTLRLELGPLAIFLAPLRLEPMLVQLPTTVPGCIPSLKREGL